MKLPGTILLVALSWNTAAESWTLDRAISRALEANPDAQIARYKVQAAEASLRSAEGAMWPRVDLRSSYTWTDNPIGVFGAALNQRSFSDSLDFNDVPAADNLSVAGVLSVPIYTGGTLSATRAQGEARHSAAAFEREAAESNLAFSVARAFHIATKTTAYIDAAEAIERSLTSSLERATTRNKEGSALKTEVLDFQVRLAEAREDLIRARNADALAKSALRNLLDMPEGSFDIDADSVDVQQPADDTRHRRPELDAMRHHIESTASSIDAARGTRRPQVSAFGSVNHDRGWRFDGDGTSYTAGVLLNWNLWDGRQSRSRIDEAERRHDIAIEEERRARLAIDLEIETAQRNLQSARARLESTAATLTLAEESVHLTVTRHEEGTAVASEVIDAESALLAARVRHIEAQTDIRLGIAELRRALGLHQTDNIPNPH